MTFLARVRRTFIGDPPELAGVTLELFRYSETVEIVDGDEYVTVSLKVDPFEPA